MIPDCSRVAQPFVFASFIIRQHSVCLPPLRFRKHVFFSLPVAFVRLTGTDCPASGMGERRT